MTDVRLDNVLDNDTLEWDGGSETVKVEHAKKIQGVTVDATSPTAGQVLVATSDTTAHWGSSSGDVSGPVSSTEDNLASWDATDGGALKDSGIATSDVILEGDARLSDARTPSAHAASHQDGGSDEINVTGLTGLLATAQTPATHHTSHQHGGADEIATASATANAIPKAGGSGKIDIGWIPTGTTNITVPLGNDARFTDARTPTSHASSHQNGGADEISVTGLSGLLADGQTPLGHKTSHQAGGADEISVAGLTGLLATAQTPAAHKTAHENGGADEISVAGLSGVLADSQVADKIATSGTAVTISSTAPSTGQVLKATSATAASWQTIPVGGDASGPAASLNNEVVAFSGTDGKTLKQTGILYTDVIVTGNAALTNARTPTAHASSHQHGGSDEIATATAGANVIPKTGAGSTLAIGFIPLGTSSSTVCVGDDSRLANSRNPTAHATSHQNGGSDQISIAGLSGRGASNQTADQIATSGTAVTISSTAPSAGQVLQASSATAASWVTKSVSISSEVSGLGTGVATFLGTPSSANLRAALTDETGTGAAVFADTPTLVTPVLGTPTSVTLTNGTGLPISTGVSGLGTGVATFLATPSSANLAAAITNETGSGSLVFATSPTLVTPVLGTPTSGNLANCTGRVGSNQTADQIATSGTAVSISSTAPSNGQVLTASSATAASWVTPSSGVSPSGTQADGTRIVSTGSSTSLWLQGQREYVGSIVPWIAIPSIQPQMGTSISTTTDNRTYWVYIGALGRTLPTTCYINMYLATAAAGSQTAEVYVASTSSAPNGTAKTLTVLAVATTLDDLTSTTNRVKRNSSPMDLSGISTGTYLWLGFRAHMATTQPTLSFIFNDLARGYCQFNSSASALTVSATDSGNLGTSQQSSQFPYLWLTDS